MWDYSTMWSIQLHSSELPILFLYCPENRAYLEGKVHFVHVSVKEGRARWANRLMNHDKDHCFRR